MNGGTVGAAVRDALGESARVVVDEQRADLSDAEAAAAAARMRADAVASVSWADAAATRAHVHMFVSADGAFHDRDLTFAPGDAMTERERAVGFLVGAMVRGARDEEPTSVTPRVPAPPPREPAPAGPAPPSADAPRIGAAPIRRALSVEAAAGGSAGIGGPALGVGPVVRIGWRATRALTLRAGGSAFFGGIDAADASTIATRIGGGIALRVASFGGDDAGTMEVGVAVLAVNHRVSRDAPAFERDRWLTAGQIGARVGFRASDVFEPFALVGAEVAAGATAVVVGPRTVAEIPLARAVAELGIAAHF